ncbi:hypothetical protein EM6_2906 [Asticcacaulis excentricus]|uniref:Uncharacterized protein n=1 Tax=Asticcacaulis excentricus TaxID=78587 RepID=A0A3G9GAL4_9CAUL|nr:hypothetical protein EM6_2906 [Asticcacaulis excentricus]
MRRVYQSPPLAQSPDHGHIRLIAGKCGLLATLYRRARLRAEAKHSLSPALSSFEAD